MYILPYFCLLKKSKMRPKFFKVLREISKNNKLDILLAAIPEHTVEYSCLQKNGYYKMPMNFLPQKLSVIIRKHLPDCPPQVTDFSKWFLTFGDYDIF